MWNETNPCLHLNFVFWSVIVSSDWDIATRLLTVPSVTSSPAYDIRQAQLALWNVTSVLLYVKEVSPDSCQTRTIYLRTRRYQADWDVGASSSSWRFPFNVISHLFPTALPSRPIAWGIWPHQRFLAFPSAKTNRTRSALACAKSATPGMQRPLGLSLVIKLILLFSAPCCWALRRSVSFIVSGHVFFTREQAFEGTAGMFINWSFHVANLHFDTQKFADLHSNTQKCATVNNMLYMHWPVWGEQWQINRVCNIKISCCAFICILVSAGT